MSGPFKLAGILGWPVQQSLSPVLHGFWLKEHGIRGAYVPLPVKPENFAHVVGALPDMGFVGANVTIPHKEAAFALVREHDSDARDTGAVNVLVFGNGPPRGLNTDVEGFRASVEERLGPAFVSRGPVVVLGAGGAARAVILALARAGAPEIRLVNRTRARAATLAADLETRARLQVGEWGGWTSAFADASLLVNTTSLGMTGKPPLELPLTDLPKAAAVVDIVYNPLETDLLRRARRAGHPTVDGLGMLMHQAVPAFAAWFGVTPKVTPALRAALEEALRA